ncbi:hypothetical protein [Caulobacter sp. 1776]|uniref:hypothetical protein n=1 Tax=Caulobacter sp. 1776 TaxID=3156420 RepID=UPI00339221E0
MAEPKVYAFHEDPYAHPLISWSGVFAGVVVAIALGALLNLLGLAIGATVANPFRLTDAGATGLTLGGGLWIVFANTFALQVGAFVAARSARFPDHHKGALIGLTVWGLAFIVALAGIGGGASAGSLLTGAQATIEASQGDDDVTETDMKAAADAARKVTAALAWWGAASMALGAVGAVAGGYLGSQHPQWHRRDRHTFNPSV